jgi:Sec-independent protein translocase protein TatA
MEFLGIGPLELLLVLVIALLVIPPNQLGKVGRSIGRFLNRMFRSDSWRIFRQASSELQNLPSRLAREAQLEELHSIEKEMALPDLKTTAFAPWAAHVDRGAAPLTYPTPAPPAAPQSDSGEGDAGSSPPAASTGASDPAPSSPPAQAGQ